MCTFSSCCCSPFHVMTSACLGSICATYDIISLVHVCHCRRLLIHRHFASEQTTFCKPTPLLMIVPFVMLPLSVLKLPVLLLRILVLISLSLIFIPCNT